MTNEEYNAIPKMDFSGELVCISPEETAIENVNRGLRLCYPDIQVNSIIIYDTDYDPLHISYTHRWPNGVEHREDSIEISSYTTKEDIIDAILHVLEKSWGVVSN